MFQSLAIHVGGGQAVHYRTGGWTISQDRTAAIWDRGFQAFLAAPNDLSGVLNRLIRP
jgi:hypothetical protein